MSAIENIEKLVSSAGDLAETKMELLKLRAAGKVSSTLSSSIAIIFLIFLGGIAVTILSFGLAYFIGNKLGNTSYGFFIVAGIYLLAGILLYANRKKWIEDPLADIFVDKIVN